MLQGSCTRALWPCSSHPWQLSNRCWLLHNGLAAPPRPAPLTSKPDMAKRRLGLSLEYTLTNELSQSKVVSERGSRFFMSQKTACWDERQ